MRRVKLGTTGLEASWVGLGTSAAYDGLLCPAKLPAAEVPRLLRYGFEQGITLWDTSTAYGTHGAIRQALRQVPRREVVICSKTVAVTARGARQALERTLFEIGIDEIDLFLLQTMRSRREFGIRAGAWGALQEMKRQGLVRAIGIASHGLGALEAALAEPAVDVVLGRVNHSGAVMDRWQEDLPSLLAGLPPIKKLVGDLLPASWFAGLATQVHAPTAPPADRQTALDLFDRLHRAGKAVIGMKIFGEGALSADVPGAVGFAAAQPWMAAMLAGCCSEREIDEVVAAACPLPGGD